MTAKGGLVEHQHVDWVITRPYLILVLLNFAGLILGIWRMSFGPEDEIWTVAMSMVWVFYNMVI